MNYLKCVVMIRKSLAISHNNNSVEVWEDGSTGIPTSRVKSLKGGGALPQVRVTNFGEGVFGTLNRARKLIFFLLVRFLCELCGHEIPDSCLPYHDLQMTSSDLKNCKNA